MRQQARLAVALEFATVVLGVVIGLQVTAPTQARAHADREAHFLRQLHADVVETERDGRRVDSLMAPQARSGTRLVRTFFLPGDALIEWFGGHMAPLRPPGRGGGGGARLAPLALETHGRTPDQVDSLRPQVEAEQAP
ncbi:hypothetical protein BSZ37_03820 [Rubrivirga marina]|uniref:Uncharacterized protein n=1 Tax=Rubrivirga marina TaxID=1196024 RepID=A0A271IWM6_9BACT|nr:hypothetical protein BSZ37_03820 [Rubrivirga marina]